VTGVGDLVRCVDGRWMIRPRSSAPPGIDLQVTVSSPRSHAPAVTGTCRGHAMTADTSRMARRWGWSARCYKAQLGSDDIYDARKNE
jgi:hypothetical protein